jgi:hypothetical protein
MADWMDRWMILVPCTILLEQSGSPRNKQEPLLNVIYQSTEVAD